MAAADAMCADCATGVVHEHSAPAGREIKLGALNAYFAPSNVDETSAVILFFTDIHGWTLPNNRLLCDIYARHGFHVYMPDFFQGDPMQRAPSGQVAGMRARSAATTEPTAEEAAAAAAQKAKMEAWRARHGDDVVLPLVRAAVVCIRSAHTQCKLGGVGFCWGGRYAILAAGSSASMLDAFVVAHPSRVQVPIDIEALDVRIPSLWCLASTDQMFTAATIEQV